MANKLLKTIVVKVLEDKQAEAITVYNVKGQSPITDVVIVATINNSRKMDAIVNQLRVSRYSPRSLESVLLLIALSSRKCKFG